MREPNLLDYEATYQKFTWEKAAVVLGIYPAQKFNIAGMAVDSQCARGLRDHIAFKFWNGATEQKFTYGELKELSE
ncbi:hypothetical protein [Thermodesulfitimonas sp.]